MEHVFYTVGHSNRTIEQFVELLESVEVAHVVDVRTMPRSRANPQFNEGGLSDRLGSCAIAYSHITELAGLRRKSTAVSESVNAWWKNRSFHNYADHALSGEFRAGLDRLLSLGHQQPCAVMCAEAVWWRCHRRIIADYLLHREERVFHLMGVGRVQQAVLNPAARVTDEGKLVYPPE